VIESHQEHGSVKEHGSGPVLRKGHGGNSMEPHESRGKHYKWKRNNEEGHESEKKSVEGHESFEG
jgi:hypothetical protein